MIFSTWRHIPLSFFVLTFLMGIIAIGAYRMPNGQAKQGESVIHTHEVLNQLEALSAHLANAQNNQRGYLLTGLQDYYLPYQHALQLIDDDLIRFQKLTADNPYQQTQVMLLREKLDAQIEALKTAIERNAPLIEEAKKRDTPVISSLVQRQAVDDQIDVMRKEEFRLLSQRIESWHSSIFRISGLFVVCVIALYGMICVIYAIIHKETEYRKKLYELEQAETDRLLQIVSIQRDIAVHRLNLESAMENICNRTQQLADADGAIVEMLEGDKMVYRAASGIAAPHVGVKLDINASLSGLCISENRVLVCDDSETDERVDREACRRVGLRSMVVVPLRHEGVAIGVLKVLSQQACIFREQHVATLELMAATLSATISDATAAFALQNANALLKEANAELAYQKSDLEHANTRLEALATTDGLTGLKNHRTLQERLAEEFQRVQRHKGNLSLVLLDVDHFKTFNDTFGHPAGDAVLRQVAALLQECGRGTDCVARYGGEEFALLLPETNADGAITIAERLRQRIAEWPWEQRAITVSVGISTFGPSTETAPQLLKIADSALYQSKTLGRNRVTHAQEMNFS